MATVEYETLEPGIVRILLNRPRYKNAQSSALIKELDRAFARAEADPAVKVVILAGAGDHFCSGHDTGTPEERADPESFFNARGLKNRLQRSWQLHLESQLRWRDMRKVTIASVQGYCIYGGYMFVASMDLVVAAEDAMFLTSHTQFFTAPWDMGVRRAKGLIFDNRFIPAQEALQIGLVNMVVPRAELERETLAMAQRIAQTDLFTLQMAKAAINNAQDAMGYRTAVTYAHSHHFINMNAALEERWASGSGDPRILAGVSKAKERLKKD